MLYWFGRPEYPMEPRHFVHAQDRLAALDSMKFKPKPF